MLHKLYKCVINTVGQNLSWIAEARFSQWSENDLVSSRALILRIDAYAYSPCFCLGDNAQAVRMTLSSN